MKFAMLICGDDDEWNALPPAEEEDLMTQIHAWFERWQPTGKIDDEGVELRHQTHRAHHPQGSRRRHRRDRRSVPGTEGGHRRSLILEADSIDEAVEIASGWPITSGMSAVEVRPVMVRN